jgi:hypothetical protein
MLQVQFNSRELDNAIAGLEELPQLLAVLEESHLPEGSFIRDVLLDGESLVCDGSLDLKGIPAERIERASNVNVISRTLKEVTAEAVEGARQYLSGLAKPISLVALQFNSGQFDKAHGNLAVLLNGISSMVNLVGSLEVNFGMDCGSVIVHRASLTTHLKDLQTQLQLLVQAQARQDTVTIADLLDYELRPRMEVWMAIFTAIMDKYELHSSAPEQIPAVSEP